MIISTIFLLASAPAVSPTRNTVVPEVGVPFACGRVFPVSQGHDTGSHLQNDTYAWDLRMPIGTPIVSAQDGKVRMARGDSTQGACDPKMAAHANYVVIEHAGGMETQYLHFSAVVVKPGDTVHKGQLLGYSGNTGWSCGPHLHFKVASTQGTGWTNPSRPRAPRGLRRPGARHPHRRALVWQHAGTADDGLSRRAAPQPASRARGAVARGRAGLGWHSSRSQGAAGEGRAPGDQHRAHAAPGPGLRRRLRRRELTLRFLGRAR